MGETSKKVKAEKSKQNRSFVSKTGSDAIGNGKQTDKKNNSVDKTPKISYTLNWDDTLYFDDDVNKVDKSATVKFKSKKGKEVWKKENVQSGTKLEFEHDPQIKIYKVEVTPKESDRYRIKKLTIPPNPKKETVPITGTSETVTFEFATKRSNTDNVDYVWREKGIDPAKANDTETTTLFGRKVTLNKVAVPKAKKAQNAFNELEAVEKREVADSIVRLGSRVKRTTTSGKFSNHSTGTAVDINANLPTKQNHHFKPNKGKTNYDAKLLKFIEKVAKSSGSMDDFDILGSGLEDKGLNQLKASQAFSANFPGYFLSLVRQVENDGSDEKSSEGDLSNDYYYDYIGKFLSYEAPAVQEEKVLQSGTVFESYANAPEEEKIFDRYQKKDIRKLANKAKKQKQTTQENELLIIMKEWTIFQSWIQGGKFMSGSKKLLGIKKGMISLHSKIISIMDGAGWEWGGDWESSKDYMHFEDVEGFKKLKKDKKPATEKKESE